MMRTRSPRLGAVWLALGMGVAVTAAHLPAAGVAAQTIQRAPLFAEVVGHDFGERITEHHQIVRYLEALEESSDRIRVIHQGESYERKGLLVAVVSHPDNIARLGEIRDVAQRLGDPRRVGEGEFVGLAEGQPVIVWLGGSIHGFELSGTEGLLRVLERLTTADDPGVDTGAGHAWPESLERLPGSVFAYEERAGAGRVVALSEDPNFRSYSRGAQRLFLNAVVLGPSAP